MLKSRMLSAVRFVTAMSCALAAACSSGGGGGGAASVPASAPSPANTTPAAPTFCSGCVGPPSLGYNFDTGISAGPIAAPAPASFGTAPAQVAVPSGPTFDGSSGSFPANVTFPLISTSLVPASPGFSATADKGATLTVISTSASSQNIQLVIPSLNLNTNINYGENIVNDIDGFTYGYSYVVVSPWDQRPNNGPLQSSTAFSFGYETPSSAMPTSGTANFSGLATASVFKAASGTIVETLISGNANLSANFSSGQVTGGLTKMQQWDGVPYNGPQGFLPWNNVSLTASIAAGSNRFSGTTAATSAPGTGFSLAGSATGHIDGAFYGPAAQNLGAVWSLSDGNASAIGTIAAH